MTLQECYTALGGNCEDVLSRLRSQRLVEKFVLKFLDDDSYNLLCRSMESKQYDEAFRAAHTIKGTCQNLSFDQLANSSSQLTEALRSDWTSEVESLFELVTADYQRTVAAIQRFQAEREAP